MFFPVANNGLGNTFADMRDLDQFFFGGCIDIQPVGIGKDVERTDNKKKNGEQGDKIFHASKISDIRFRILE